MGEWFYPNGSLVGENDHIDLQGFYPNGSLVGENDHIDLQGFYKSRGTAKVQLSRREGITSPTGKFCCQVPNANNTSISICVNLSESFATILILYTNMLSFNFPYSFTHCYDSCYIKISKWLWFKCCCHSGYNCVHPDFHCCHSSRHRYCCCDFFQEVS